MEDGSQVRYLDDVGRAGRQPQQLQVAALPAQAQELGDQHSDAGAVDVIHAGKVGDNLHAPFPDERIDPIPQQLVPVVEYQTAVQGQDGDLSDAALVYRHHGCNLNPNRSRAFTIIVAV